LLYSIYPLWNLLVGFPGEEEDVYQKYVADIPRLTHLPPPSGVYPVRFDRFSPYFVQAKEYGLDLRPLDYYSLIYPFDDESLSNLAYYFDDRNVRAPYRIKMTRWIDHMQRPIEYWKMRWSSEDGKTPRPGLHFNGKPNHVYDSRGDQVIEHDVGEVGRRLLDYLAQPRRQKDVAGALGDVGAREVEEHMRRLEELGLVFEEGDRVLSLVLPKETPRMKKIC
jgi:hypothetical protein